MSYVWVELDNVKARNVIRIFRYQHQAMKDPAWDSNRVQLLEFAQAALWVRLAVFKRDDYACVHCGNLITWDTGEMHERQPRGRIRQTEDGEYRGGEISIENSETRCAECHRGRGGAHKRHIMWSSLA